MEVSALKQVLICLYLLLILLILTTEYDTLHFFFVVRRHVTHNDLLINEAVAK
jgi:hypothetical protein